MMTKDFLYWIDWWWGPNPISRGSKYSCADGELASLLCSTKCRLSSSSSWRIEPSSSLLSPDRPHTQVWLVAFFKSLVSNVSAGKPGKIWTLNERVCIDQRYGTTTLTVVFCYCWTWRPHGLQLRGSPWCFERATKVQGTHKNLVLKFDDKIQ